MKICSIDGCEKKHTARGYCPMHYSRLKRTGKTGGPGEITWTISPCSVDGCEVKAHAKGYCANHYQLWHSNGDPLLKIKGNPAESFRKRTQRRGDCVEWTGNVDSAGYGIVWVDGRRAFAHRWSYSHFIEPIPEGMFIDHMCHNTSCVKPTHLRLATPKQNVENPSGLRRDNASGYRGVHWDKRAEKWVAEVWHLGKKLRVGSFVDIETANSAVVDARNNLFTHNIIDRQGAMALDKETP